MCIFHGSRLRPAGRSAGFQESAFHSRGSKASVLFGLMLLVLAGHAEAVGASGPGQEGGDSIFGDDFESGDLSAWAPVGHVLNPGFSCRHILEARGSATPSGIYWIIDGGPPYEVDCDMTTDGGGWTTVFSGLNGSVNVFDHFDALAYQGICSDPAERCLRHASSWVGASASELAVACGPAVMKFPLTNATRDWLVAGVQSNWTALEPTVLAGSVANPPNGVFTGVGVGNESFIFARNQGGLGNTFGSSYSNGTSFDYCNGVFDTSSLTRVSYRETLPRSPLNSTAEAGASCKQLLSGGATADGVYWLSQAPGDFYLAYCDMTTDGGGWTSIFVGRNGSPHVFDWLDAGAYAGVCTDPATRCLRRAPATFTGGEVLAGCGATYVRFPATASLVAWLRDGTQAAWLGIAATVVAGTVPNVPNSAFTGDVNTRSFILARNQGGLGNTFGSSYSNGTSFDYCNGVSDSTSLTRIYYREP